MTASTSPRRRFTTPTGGITTKEVGAITGDVEAWLDGDRLRITYVGAEEAYTVVGTRAGDNTPRIINDRGTESCRARRP